MTDTPPMQLVFSRERRFTSVPYEQIAPRASSWLIKGALPKRGTGFMVGASKAGKTFVALDWAIKIAAGAETIMQRKAKQVGVVYLAAEDPEGCKLRIEAFKRKRPRASYTPFRLIGEDGARVNLLDPDEVAQFIVELQDIAAIYEAEGHPLGLVVIDTFSRCIPGAEENSSEKMSLAVEGLDRIAREMECLVLALAHHGKAGASNGIRGWSGLDGASDATITVERDEENPDYRTITLSKVKNGLDGGKMAFSLEPQPIGLFDEDDEELWSCVVKYDYADAERIKPTKKRKALSNSAEIVMRSLGTLIDRQQCQSPPVGAEGVRAGTWAVRRSDLSLEAITLGLRFDGEKANTYNARFGRAVQELQAAHKVRVFGDSVWPV